MVLLILLCVYMVSVINVCIADHISILMRDLIVWFQVGLSQTAALNFVFCDSCMLLLSV